MINFWILTMQSKFQDCEILDLLQQQLLLILMMFIMLSIIVPHLTPATGWIPAARL